jgi:pyruvate dehydrogenase E2 component (dihydrolipoamide acetyltransferase)
MHTPESEASPRARRALRRWNINPSLVQPTGPGGRIVENDVLNAKSVTASLQEARIEARQPPAGARGVAARKIPESLSAVRYFHLRVEVDATLLLSLREQVNEQMNPDDGQRLSVTDLLLRAMALALHDCPQANCVWQSGAIVPLPQRNVGLMIHTDDGLVIPIVQDADGLPLRDLVKRRRRLVEDARNHQLPDAALQGTATTLSNLGQRYVDDCAAIVSPSHSSALAVGRAAWRPFVHDSRLCRRRTLHLTLSVDHRVMDGGQAADYLERVSDLLQNPFPLFCKGT